MSDTAPPAPSALTLGTAQLGLPYGQVVRSAPPDEDGALALLDAAWDGGVRAFDTAAAYGPAEDRIGAWRRARGQRPFLVTRLPKAEDAPDAASILAACHTAGRRLAAGTIDIMLVHRPADAGLPGVVEGLRAAVDAGVVGRFGVSVYTPEEAGRALDIPGTGALQIPLSVADRRFVDQGIVGRAAAAGVLVFARSVYLQGVLLMPPAAPPAFLAPLRPLIAALGVLAREAGVAPAALALAAVGRVPGVASTVVGAADPGDLAETLAAAAETVPDEAVAAAIAAGRDTPEALLDPRNWPGTGSP